MSDLLMEIRAPDGWLRAGALGPDGGSGSISNNASGNREILMFENHGTHSTIKRSVAGTDSELGSLRAVTSLGYEELASLDPGEVYEFDMQTDNMAGSIRARFRQE